MEIICKEYLNNNLWGLLKIRFIRYHASMKIQIVNSLNSLDSCNPCSKVMNRSPHYRFRIQLKACSCEEDRVLPSHGEVSAKINRPCWQQRGRLF
jgi:hypothetical protein